jgi:phosphatidate cytidylyltransferase
VSNLVLRVLSASVLIPVALAATWYGTPWFEALVLVIVALMLLEWRRLTAPGAGPVWLFAGALYAGAFGCGLLALRLAAVQGAWLVFYLFACIWATDTAAYVGGRTIGGPKLAPRISPNKTWAGFVAGLVGGTLAGALVAVWLDSGLVQAALAGAAVSLLGQFGDLLESAVKRHFDAKDSGHLIPGHGGVLDRVDSLAVAAPGLAVLYLITGGTLPLGS